MTRTATYSVSSPLVLWFVSFCAWDDRFGITSGEEITGVIPVSVTPLFVSDTVERFLELIAVNSGEYS